MPRRSAIDRSTSLQTGHFMAGACAGARGSRIGTALFLLHLLGLVLPVDAAALAVLLPLPGAGGRARAFPAEPLLASVVVPAPARGVFLLRHRPCSPCARSPIGPARFADCLGSRAAPARSTKRTAEEAALLPRAARTRTRA